MTGGVFEVPNGTSNPTLYFASNTNPIAVTVDILNNGGVGNDKHFEGPTGTYKNFSAPPIFPPTNFSGGCTNSLSPPTTVGGDVVNTDPGTTPVPTVKQGASSTNLCSSPTAVSIKRELVSPGPHQVRTVTFTCKDPGAAAATTYTLSATGALVGGQYIDPPCNPPLMSIDCVDSDVRLS